MQPGGTVTLVFTDIEGSTALLDELGVEAYREALADHRRVVRKAFAAQSGYEVDDAGDGLFYAFAVGVGGGLGGGAGDGVACRRAGADPGGCAYG